MRSRRNLPVAASLRSSFRGVFGRSRGSSVSIRSHWVRLRCSTACGRSSSGDGGGRGRGAPSLALALFRFLALEPSPYPPNVDSALQNALLT